MRICIYEDNGVALLEPLALTRPAFALWCGAQPLLDRQRAALGADEVGLWVRPELVAEVKYLTWTEDNLLRQVVYEGLREDKPPKDVRRPIPHPRPAS